MSKDLSTHDPVEVARRFALALDQSDWAAVAACMSHECEYAIRGEVSVGREPIVSSYRTIAEWVDATFESVRYESAVEAVDARRARISFRDYLDHGEHHLDFQCQQIITLSADGTIAHIEHVDVPGEPEKVTRFNLACGVKKP